MGKAAGRHASEPRCSLVTYLDMPTLWSEGEGRCLRDSNEHPPSGSSGGAGAACGGRDTVQDGRPARCWYRTSNQDVEGEPKSPRAVVGVGGVHRTGGGLGTTEPGLREGTLLCSHFQRVEDQGMAMALQPR